MNDQLKKPHATQRTSPHLLARWVGALSRTLEEVAINQPRLDAETRRLYRVLARAVLDRRGADGGELTEDQSLAFLERVKEHAPELHAVLHIAKHGRTPDGEEVTWKVRSDALTTVEKLNEPEELAYDPAKLELIEQYGDAELARRDDRRTIKLAGLATGLADGALAGDRDRQLSDDRPRHTARELLEQAAGELGLDAALVLRPIAHGRPTPAERERRDQLARIVHRAHTRGATLDAISHAIGLRDRRRVTTLNSRGRELDAA
jgi:hypothetical protein